MSAIQRRLPSATAARARPRVPGFVVGLLVALVSFLCAPQAAIARAATQAAHVGAAAVPVVRLPHPRGAREASEHGFGGGRRGEAARVGASSDAWGNATDSDVTCASGAVCAPFQPFGFAGGLFDRQTGLTRFGARDYDPSVERWTQKDRSGLSAGPNVYAYASGDPVDFVDRDGHRSFSCGSILVGGLEGAVNDLAAQAFRAAANSFCDPGGSSTDINRGEVAQAAALGALGGALSGNCFEAGTLVATCANGEQPIETLREGDEVLSRNAETGETACRQVVHTYVHDADDVARLRVSADDGGDQKEESFAVTLGHPFWVDGRGWTPVRELAPGDVLATAAGEARVLVGGWAAEGGSARVFNLEVEGDHSYFVGRGGVWVHNGCGITFIGQERGPSFAVPEGAESRLPTRNGLGIQFIGGQGGPGLSPSASGLRIMDPTVARGPSPGYPGGYGVYFNGSGQTINPYTGQTPLGNGGL